VVEGGVGGGRKGGERLLRGLFECFSSWDCHANHHRGERQETSSRASHNQFLAGPLCAMSEVKTEVRTCMHYAITAGGR
jgi:hypothetical protein